MYFGNKIDIWNELPEQIVEAGTITAFLRLLDMYIDRKRLEGCGQNMSKLD